MQQVKGMPSLSVYNKFAPLENIIISEPPEMRSSPEQTNQDIPTPKTRKRSVPRWEQRLPKQYVLAVTPSTKSLSIKVELQMTDTAEIKSSLALIDCGMTGKFLSKQFVEEHRITTQTLTWAIPLFNVDSTANENGAITEVADLILRYEGHTE